MFYESFYKISIIPFICVQNYTFLPILQRL